MPDISEKKRVPKMPIRIHPKQRRALERIAKKRGTTATALICEQVAVLTGVPDPLERKGRRGANGSYRPGQPRKSTRT